MNEVLKISLIIPTLNRPESLKRTLEFYKKGKIVPDQIIVVDQTDISEYIDLNKRMLYNLFGEEENKYIHQDEKSLTLARNVGIKNADNEIIIFSDDDIDVETETLINIKEIFQKDSSISMIGGFNKNAKMDKESILGYFWGTKSFFKRHNGHVTKSMLGRFPDTLDKECLTEWAMGFFFVVRRSLIYRWNLHFDTYLKSYAYAEDLDFTFSYYKESKKNNYKCIFTPKIKVAHNNSNEYRIPSFQSTVYYLKNRRYLIRKHKMGYTSRILCEWTNIGMLIRRIIYRQKPYDFLKAFLGFYNGY